MPARKSQSQRRSEAEAAKQTEAEKQAEVERLETEAAESAKQADEATEPTEAEKAETEATEKATEAEEVKTEEEETEKPVAPEINPPEGYEVLFPVGKRQDTGTYAAAFRPAKKVLLVVCEHGTKGEADNRHDAWVKATHPATFCEECKKAAQSKANDQGASTPEARAVEAARLAALDANPAR